MKTNLILLSFLLAVINCFAGKNPNIILILADDMGPGEPSHMGGLVPTPALDRMAKEGMRFTDAHTTSSVCTCPRSRDGAECIALPATSVGRWF